MYGRSGHSCLGWLALEGAPTRCWYCQFLVLVGEVLVQEMWAACATAAGCVVTVSARTCVQVSLVCHSPSAVPAGLTHSVL